MKHKKKPIYVGKEKLPIPSATPSLTSADIAKISIETRKSLKIDYPASNLTTFIELV